MVDLNPYAAPRPNTPQLYGGSEVRASVHIYSDRALFRRSAGIFGEGTVRLESWGLALSGRTPGTVARLLEATVALPVVAFLVLTVVVSFDDGAYRTWKDNHWLYLLYLFPLAAYGLRKLSVRYHVPHHLTLTWADLRRVIPLGLSVKLDTAHGRVTLVADVRPPYGPSSRANLDYITAVAYGYASPA